MHCVLIHRSEILKDFSITPVFTEKAAPQHTLTLERAKHGTASYIREGKARLTR